MTHAIGPYEIIDRQGAGGMGEVFRARDPATGAIVAVKRLKGEPEDVGLRLRFRREIRVMSRLRHPNIVRVLDHGVLGGEPYFAMEFIQGETLGEHFRLGPDEDPADPLRLRRVVRALVQAARALAYLHGERIMHRDLKPGNLMILPDGTVKLMDFGLVKELGGEEDSTTGAVMVGSSFYLSPEAATSSAMDGRADLFSLGVVLYELISGTRPFEADSLFAVLFKITQQDPPPLDELVTGVPAELARIVARLLAKDPADRYQSAEELVAELEGWLREAGEAPPARPPEPLHPGSYLLQPRFVAREGPLRILLNRIGEVDPDGQLVAVTGGPGLGKTRLLDEISARAQGRGLRVLRGACLETAGQPLEPFQQIGSSLARLFAGFSTEQFSKVVGSDAGIVGRLLRSADRPASLRPGQDSEESQTENLRLRTFTALAGLFRRLGLETPVLIAIDDLQWADPDTLDLIDLIARTAAIEGYDGCRASVTVLGTYQPEALAANPTMAGWLERLRADGRLLEVPLAPLGPTDSAEMVRSMIGRRDLPGGLLERIQTETQGNPFYIREVLSALVERQLLVRAGEGWTLSAGAEELPIPDSIREAVRRRISALGEEQRKLLEWAAVIGREFTFPVLRTVLRASDDELLDRLDPLLRFRLLTEDRRAGPLRLAFADEKVREVIYAGLAPARRRLAHAAVAHALEEEAGDALDAAEDLARHLSAAGDPVRALRYLLAAGDRALQEAGYVRSVAHFNAAEAVLGRSDVSSAAAQQALDRVLLGRARARRVLGENAAALRDLGRLKRRAERRRDATLRGQALLEIGIVHRNLGRLDDAAASLIAARDILVGSGTPEEVRRAVLNLAVTRRGQGRIEESSSLAQEALGLYREAGDLAGSAKALSLLGALALAAGDPDRAEPFLWEALDAYRDAGHRAGAATVLTQLGTLASNRGDFRAAVDCYSEALPITSKVGSRANQGRLILNLGDVYLEEGDLERALLHLEEALESFGQSGDRQGEARALVSLARLQLMEGRAAEAFVTCQRARSLQKETGDRALYALASLTLGRIFGELARPAEEVAAYGEAERIALAVGESRILAETLLATGQAHLRGGNLDWARTEAQRALGLARNARFGTTLWRIHELLYRIEKARGQTESADEHLREAALALWTLYDNLPDDRARESFVRLPHVAAFAAESGLALDGAGPSP